MLRAGRPLGVMGRPATLEGDPPTLGDAPTLECDAPTLEGRPAPRGRAAVGGTAIGT